jgi:hypothetical protein
LSTPGYDAGRAVLGPIFARFARDLRLHAGAAGPEDDVALLFCARGGLRMRLAYEAACASLGMGTGGRTADLMVSRLQAAKVGLPHAAEAVDEFVRECAGRDLRDAARLVLDPEQAHLAEDPSLVGAPVTADGMARLFGRSDALGVALLARSLEQRIAFHRHLVEASDDRGRLVLVDTGLFGGTMRILERTFPAHVWSCALFGRANYRRTHAPHFARTTGLVFEADRPNPRRPVTALLRHWHLVEGLFEPELPSATSMSLDPDGRPRSDLEIPGWRAKVEARGMPLFDGMIDYLRALTAADVADVDRAAERAERQLARMILHPSRRDVEALDVGARSMDFGRAGASLVIRPLEGGPVGRIWSVRHALWREGQIRRAVPLAGCALLAFGAGRRLVERAPRLLAVAQRVGRKLSKARFEGTGTGTSVGIVNPEASH